ncbi:MAG: metalloregulator ArsR/SmtB family transcription factor [Steroidobacteraceae bacterium]|jgi:DNA-binding transcriptional ArsR family regulator|nr:metalloregulator ArsR/SmtB family transcription factor [Steroidobacteraceae bacterium]
MTSTSTPNRNGRTRGSAASRSRAQSMRPHAESAAALLKALANPQRLLILCHLADGELAVGELIARLPLGQSATSQHLAILREQGIVATRRVAQAIYYSLQPGPAARVVEVLHGIYCGDAPGREAPGRR